MPSPTPFEPSPRSRRGGEPVLTSPRRHQQRSHFRENVRMTWSLLPSGGWLFRLHTHAFLVGQHEVQDVRRLARAISRRSSHVLEQVMITYEFKELVRPVPSWCPR